MCKGEQLTHLEADLDFYKDRQLVTPSANNERNILAISREIEITRSDESVQPETQSQTPTQSRPQTPTQTPTQTQTQTPTQTQTQTPEEPVQRHPSGWTPIDWPPYKKNLVLFVTTCRFTVNSFVRSIIINLRPFFSQIMPLVLYALVMISTPFIIDIYTMLTSILGEYIGSAVNALYLVILLFCKILLMIRRANKSAVLYDRFFKFAANHISSGILYFFILLLSVALVYCCV